LGPSRRFRVTRGVAGFVFHLGENASLMSTILNMPPESLTDLSIEELAKRANEAASDVHEYGVATVDSAIKAGVHLIAAKGRCGHGNWLAWLDANWSLSRSYASRFMKLAANVDSTSHLHSIDVASESISSALREIAAKDKKQTRRDQAKQASEDFRKSQERKDAEILRILNEGGYTWSAIAEQNHCGVGRVRDIYTEHVMPSLLQIDWVSRAKSALVKGLQAAKDKDAIIATVRHEGYRGGWTKLAGERLGISVAEVECASRVCSKGCPALVSRLEAGDIALNAAKELAALPHDEQREQLKDKQRKRAVDAFDELRSRASTLLDQKLGWQQFYGRNGKTLRELAQSADTEELSEIVKCFDTVAAWCGDVVSHLKEE